MNEVEVWLALSDPRTHCFLGSNFYKNTFSVSQASPFPVSSLNLRSGSSGVCQVSAPAQASSISPGKPIVIQRKLMIQQVLDVWSPRKQPPGIWTIHCWPTTLPATKCFPEMSSHLTPTVAGLAWALGLMMEWKSQRGWSLPRRWRQLILDHRSVSGILFKPAYSAEAGPVSAAAAMKTSGVCHWWFFITHWSVQSDKAMPFQHPGLHPPTSQHLVLLSSLIYKAWTEHWG